MSVTEAAVVTKTISFQGPGDDEWRVFLLNHDPGDTSGQVDKEKERLNSTLLSSLQMHNLIVLAGSGCSFSAGGPSMRELWAKSVGTDDAANGPRPEAERIAQKVNHDISDDNIEAFLSKMETFLYVWGDTDEGKDVEAFLNNTKETILNECSKFLPDQPDVLAAHRTFLHRLSRRRTRDPRLKLFTTNYDLCFERAAASLGIVALDGFSFMSPRRYDPRFFSYDIVRRPQEASETSTYLEGVFQLYKLHGSVNWTQNDDGAIIERDDPNPEEACIIYPARGKYQKSFTQPHLEAMAQYLNSLRTPNACVIVIGWGFADSHLATPLVNAVRSNPHLRIIVVDPGLERGEIRGNDHVVALNELRENDADIWFINVGFEDFSNLIPDLASLTPADSLFQAVQVAAQQRAGDAK